MKEVASVEIVANTLLLNKFFGTLSAEIKTAMQDGMTKLN